MMATINIRNLLKIRFSARNMTAVQSPTSTRDHSKDRKLTTLELQHMKRKGKRISMLTAYDYPTAKHAERAGIDMVLVGDSLGMVVLGYETTLPVTIEDMLHHCKAVRRGAPSRFIVGDLPFGSYESGPEEALKNAYRLVKEAGVDAVKLEGGKSRVNTVRKLVDCGVAVMGHVGLTPQGISVLGGFRAQGRTAIKARAIVDDALALQDAGAFSIVVECVPSIVAKAVTDALRIPVIGIGAGPHTTGQVLVYHDLLGVEHHPHFEKHVPSFCKKYAKLGANIDIALTQYRDEVHRGQFPTEEYSPYTMSAEEQARFIDLMQADKDDREGAAKIAGRKILEADEYDITRLY